MMTATQKVDDYIEKSADFAKPILRHLRALVHEACPQVEEDWKWSFPVFAYKGSIMCNMAAFKAHCSFGFWKAAVMPDPDHILNPGNKDGMGQLGKIEHVDQLPPDGVIVKYIKVAMELNEKRVKVPPKAKEAAPKELLPPSYFLTLLAGSEKATTIWHQFSNSNKKEYIDWFTEAKTEATRNKRIDQAIVWIEEGKPRNWKYMKC